MILNNQNCIRLLQGVEISLRSVARFWNKNPKGKVLEMMALNLRKIIIEEIREKKKENQKKQLQDYEERKKEIKKKYEASLIKP